MTAKGFYELNKGEYFMYNGEKVRVVGFCTEMIAPLPIMVAYKEGCWAFPYSLAQISYEWRKSLINDGDMGKWVNIEALNPLEPKNIDLCEILKGCEGMELWCDLFGKCRLLTTEGDNSPHEIEIELIDEGADKDVIECFTSDGKFYAGYPNGKCMLWPSETNRDWSTFVKPISVKEGDPVMTKWNSAAFWKLENYTKDNKSFFIVPVSDFDFSDFDSNKSKSIV